MKQSDSFVDSYRLAQLKTDPEFLPERVNLFLDDTFRLVNDIKEFAYEQEPLNMMRVAHSLQGFSSDVGAVYIADISRQIEIKGKNDDLSEIDVLIKRLEEGYERTKIELKRICNREFLLGNKFPRG